MVLDRRGIGHQAVDRHQGGDRRKDREQGIVGHACRHGHEPVLPELLVGPPQDVLPAERRDLRRRVGFASALFLACGCCGRSRRPSAAILTWSTRTGLTALVLDCRSRTCVAGKDVTRQRPSGHDGQHGDRRGEAPALLRVLRRLSGSGHDGIPFSGMQATARLGH